MRASPRRAVGFLGSLSDGENDVLCFQNGLNSAGRHVCEYFSVLFCMFRGGLLMAAVIELCDDSCLVQHCLQRSVD